MKKYIIADVDSSGKFFEKEVCTEPDEFCCGDSTFRILFSINLTKSREYFVQLVSGTWTQNIDLFNSYCFCKGSAFSVSCMDRDDIKILTIHY